MNRPGYDDRAGSLFRIHKRIHTRPHLSTAVYILPYPRIPRFAVLTRKRDITYPRISPHSLRSVNIPFVSNPARFPSSPAKRRRVRFKRLHTVETFGLPVPRRTQPLVRVLHGVRRRRLRRGVVPQM